MVLHGAAYLLFRKSPIGYSTRLKINNNEESVVSILKTFVQVMKNNDMAQGLATTMKQHFESETRINK